MAIENKLCDCGCGRSRPMQSGGKYFESACRARDNRRKNNFKKKSSINRCSQDFNNIDKPDWYEHDYKAICMCGNSNWFGLNEAKKPPYSEGWKGKQLHLHCSRGGFLKYGENKNNIDIELLYEERPSGK